MQTIEVTGCAREYPQGFKLPMDQPPILVMGDKGEPVLLMNDGAGVGPGPDHLQASGFAALGPFTPAELLAALAATGRVCQVHDGFYEREAKEAEVAERLAGLEAEFGLEIVIEGALSYGLGPSESLLARAEKEREGIGAEGAGAGDKGDDEGGE